MNQNPNPYEGTNYGSNQPGGSNPNNPYEQYEPTQRAEPYQQQPYAPPPAGGQGSGSYPPPQYSPQQQGAAPNPYSYPNPPSAPPPAYNQPGTYSPTPPPVAPRRSSGGRILIIALVILLVLAAIAAVVYIPLHNTQVSNSNATATAQTNGTATAHTATAQAQVHATATAQFIATATAVANTFPFSANVVLNDPLSSNSGSKWKTDSNCTFTGGAYHAAESTNNTYYTCPALSTNFSNFTYQVTMQVNKGDIAGITFRGDEASSKNYAFIFSSKDGSYVLFLYTSSTNPRTLQSGTAAGFNTGLGQKNDIGVVAQGSTIDLYVNKQKLTSTSDSTLSSGQVGTIVYDTGDAADVSFNNAMVWSL